MISIVMLARVEHDIIRKMTREAIRSIRENTEETPVEFILIRNGGHPLMISRGETGLPGVTLDFPEGLPLGQAYNRGFEKAHGDTFCVLHNDVVLPGKWNVPLEKAAAKGYIGFPMIDEEKGFPELRHVNRTMNGQPTAACFMMSKATWESIGGYDEEYQGFHWEDMDLFYRAHKAGIRLVRCDLTVVHHKGATRSFVLGEEKKYFPINMEYHRRKHGELYIPVISELPQEV